MQSESMVSVVCLQLVNDSGNYAQYSEECEVGNVRE